MTPKTLEDPVDTTPTGPDAHEPSPTGPGAGDGGSKDRVWREWLAVGEGLTGLLSVIAIIISLVALASAGSSAGTTTTMTMPATAAPAAAATPAVAPTAFTMAYRSDTEHGRKGPDGKWHDAASNAIYAVRAGSKVTVTLVNYDSSPHSFTAPSWVPIRSSPVARPATQARSASASPRPPGRAARVVLQGPLRPVGNDAQRLYARLRDRAGVAIAGCAAGVAS